MFDIEKQATGQYWVRWTSPRGMYYWLHPIEVRWVSEPEQINMPTFPSYAEAVEASRLAQPPRVDDGLDAGQAGEIARLKGELALATERLNHVAQLMQHAIDAADRPFTIDVQEWLKILRGESEPPTWDNRQPMKYKCDQCGDDLNYDARNGGVVTFQPGQTLCWKCFTAQKPAVAQ